MTHAALAPAEVARNEAVPAVSGRFDGRVEVHPGPLVLQRHPG